MLVIVSEVTCRLESGGGGAVLDHHVQCLGKETNMTYLLALATIPLKSIGRTLVLMYPTELLKT